MLLHGKPLVIVEATGRVRDELRIMLKEQEVSKSLQLKVSLTVIMLLT